MAPDAGMLLGGLNTFLRKAMTQCTVLGGTSALLMQCLLFAISCLVLFCKWRCGKKPRRYWKVFGWDVSKQVSGYLCIHIMNMIFAKLLSQREGLGDQCDWYLVNILVDTTIGTFLLWVLLRIVQRLLVWGGEATEDLVDFGSYKGRGTETRNDIFIQQLVMWLCICIVMKLLMVAVMAWQKNELISFSIMLLSSYKHYPDEKRLYALVLLPVIMNTFQLVVVDSFIAKQLKKPRPPQKPPKQPTPPPSPLKKSTPPPTPPPDSGDIAFVLMPERVRLPGIEKFIENGVMSKTKFLKFVETKKVSIDYGFRTLAQKDIEKFYDRMKVGGADVTEEQIDRAFESQKKLMDIFNSLDARDASKVSDEDFMQACTRNPGLCSLFGIYPRAGNTEVEEFDIRQGRFKVFPSKSDMRFKDVHAYMHTEAPKGAGLDMDGLYERLQRFQESQTAERGWTLSSSVWPLQ